MMEFLRETKITKDVLHRFCCLVYRGIGLSKTCEMVHHYKYVLVSKTFKMYSRWKKSMNTSWNGYVFWIVVSGSLLVLWGLFRSKHSHTGVTKFFYHFACGASRISLVLSLGFSLLHNVHLFNVTPWILFDGTPSVEWVGLSFLPFYTGFHHHSDVVWSNVSAGESRDTLRACATAQ